MWLKRLIHPKAILYSFCALYTTTLLIDISNLHLFVDELSFLINIAHFAYKKTIIPLYTDYPSFYSYLTAIPTYAVFFVNYLVKGYPLSGLESLYFIDFVFQTNHMLWITTLRLISIFFSVLILIILFQHVYRHYGFGSSLISGLFIILTPLSIYASHARYALPDILIVLLCLVVYISCLKYIKDSAVKCLYWASFLAGLAASSKLNGAFLFFMVFFAPIIKAERAPFVFKLKRLGMVCALALFGFLIGSPAYILEPNVFYKGFLHETSILIQHGAVDYYQGPWPWMLQHLWANDLILTLLIVTAVAYSLFKLKQADMLFLVLLIPSVLIVSSLEKRSFLYILFLYPLVIIQISRLVAECHDKIKFLYFRRCLIACTALLFVFYGSRTYARLAKSILPDNRTIAKEWIYKNIPAPAFLTMDPEYIPYLMHRVILVNFSKKMTLTSEEATYIKEYKSIHKPYILTWLNNINYDLSHPDSRASDYLIISNYHYNRYLTAKMKKLAESSNQSDENIKITRFYLDVLNNRTKYKFLKEFTSGSGPVIKIFKREPH